MLLTPCVTHCGRDVGPQLLPSFRERGLGFVVGVLVTGALLVFIASGIEATGPLPDHPTFGAVDFGHPANLNVTVEDAPRLVMLVVQKPAG